MIKEVKLPMIKQIEWGLFSPQEVRSLLGAADGEWKTIILLGYFTGARLGDCCHIRWQDVDLEHGIFSYTEQKTKKRVLVAIHPALKVHLEKIRGTSNGEMPLTPGMAGRQSGGRDGLSEGFKNIVRKAGLDLQTTKGAGSRSISRRTFHSLRQSFIASIVEARLPRKLCIKLLGQKCQPPRLSYSRHDVALLQDAMIRLSPFAIDDLKTSIENSSTVDSQEQTPDLSLFFRLPQQRP